jgi:hypothetical protein
MFLRALARRESVNIFAHPRVLLENFAVGCYSMHSKKFSTV